MVGRPSPYVMTLLSLVAKGSGDKTFLICHVIQKTTCLKGCVTLCVEDPHSESPLGRL